MAMVVQHNMMAANSNRMLGVTTGSQAKSSEKLSSGYKINRAADDAAGLTISEKMRSQVRGLNRASTNAQDGVSLIQTAEGALNEAHSILQRMNELAVQGANDTNQQIDRDAINEELASLTEELDRISQTTQFNKQELLDGTFEGKKLQVGANTNQFISITIKSMNAVAIGLTGNTIKLPAGSAALVSGLASATISAASGDALSIYSGAGTAGVVNSAGLTRTSTWNSMVPGAAASTTRLSVANSTTSATIKSPASITMGNINNPLSNFLGAGAAGQVSTGMVGGVISRVSLVSAVGVSAQVPLSTTASGAGTALRVDNYSIANETLCQIQNAINNVSKQRSALGALQNRLEHTIANLDNVAENTQAAESRIRDTDMASEMVEYSKNNILAQAGQSMLAQSNQSTQGVLSLLQ